MTTPTNVLVTGGGGRLGAYVVDELVAHHAVRVADLKPPRRDVDFTRTDVLDLAALTAVMQGCDAVVHLAAIPNPRDKAAEVVFGINLLGTWNVLHAAHELGISKVVLCSSECATGLCYQSEDRPPLYLPVDEAHSLRPVDPYSLSKQMGEVAGQSFARRGMTVTVLRPTYILFPDEHDSIAERGRDPAHPALWSYVEPERAPSASPSRTKARASRSSSSAPPIPSRRHPPSIWWRTASARFPRCATPPSTRPTPTRRSTTLRARARSWATRQRATGGA
jgi:NAD(P)-dependent dehydrogenase (short-subunit alcohol dehydrogenase family)